MLLCDLCVQLQGLNLSLIQTQGLEYDLCKCQGFIYKILGFLLNSELFLY
jgi:hypothetical protein